MDRERTTKYILSLTDKAHGHLKQLALDRSAQLGERVGMGFVVAELLLLHGHLLSDRKDSAIYGSVDNHE